MAIAYDSTLNIITVTDYSSGSPCSFEDIYQADVSGSWGVVSKQGDSQYTFDARIVIGDGSTTTYFADISKQIVISSLVITTSYQPFMDVRAKGYLRIGYWYPSPANQKYKTYNGCAFRSEATLMMYFFGTGQDGGNSDRYIYLYGSYFETTTASNRLLLHFRNGTFRVWNNTCVHVSPGVCTPYGDNAVTADIYNMIFEGQGWLIYAMTGITLDKVEGMNIYYYIWTQGNTSFTVSNLYARQISYLFNGSTSWSGTVYLIDADTDSWSFLFHATATGKVYRQYTFNLKTEPNATVTLKDKDSTEVFSVTADENGDIAEQTVSRGYYTQSTGNTLNDYGPHTLTIEKSGYQKYEKEITLSEKISWEIKLLANVPVRKVYGRGFIRKESPEEKKKSALLQMAVTALIEESL